MQDKSLEDALAELGLAIHRKTSFGAAPPPVNELVRIALEHLRKFVCPNSAMVLQTAGSKEAQLATLISDSVMSFRLGAPFPATTAARLILSVGLERFCADPDELRNR